MCTFGALSLSVWTADRASLAYAATGGGAGASGSGSPTVPVINMLNAGAKGGAVDDTAAVQAALNLGGNVYFPPSTNYTIGTVYPTNGNLIYGAGTRIALLNTVSNAAMFDWKSNTNVAMRGLVGDGGAYNGSYAVNGTTNRQGVAAYAYAGRASYISDCVFLGFDYGIRLTGDKTVTTAHQTSTLNIHDITCYSNFAGVYFNSPDATHVVEYVTVNHINSFFNTWGIVIDAGNINAVDCDFNNNSFGVGMPGSGFNNSHGSIVGSKINHNTTAALAFTNITTGEIITGNQIQSDGNCYFNACQGINLGVNEFSPIFLWYVNGASTKPNFLWNNSFAATYGGGSGFTPINIDGSLNEGPNWSLTDNTGSPAYFRSTHTVTLTESAATTVFTAALPIGKSAIFRITALTRANDATDFQARTDHLMVSAVNKAGTITTTVSTIGTGDTAAAVSTGTLTTTWTAVDNTGNVLAVKNNAVSSLTQTTLVCQWQMETESNAGDAAGCLIITPQ